MFDLYIYIYWRKLNSKVLNTYKIHNYLKETPYRVDNKKLNFRKFHYYVWLVVTLEVRNGIWGKPRKAEQQSDDEDIGLPRLLRRLGLTVIQWLGVSLPHPSRPKNVPSPPLMTIQKLDTPSQWTDNCRLFSAMFQLVLGEIDKL